VSLAPAVSAGPSPGGSGQDQHQLSAGQITGHGGGIGSWARAGQQSEKAKNQCENGQAVRHQVHQVDQRRLMMHPNFSFGPVRNEVSNGSNKPDEQGIPDGKEVNDPENCEYHPFHALTKVPTAGFTGLAKILVLDNIIVSLICPLESDALIMAVVFYCLLKQPC
jgi:hypothetical protein